MKGIFWDIEFAQSWPADRGRSGGAPTPLPDEVLERRSDVLKERGPLTNPALAEEPSTPIPRRICSVEEPTPTWDGAEADPQGGAQCAGKVGRRAVRGDNQVQLPHDRGRLGPVG